MSQAQIELALFDKLQTAHTKTNQTHQRVNIFASMFCLLAHSLSALQPQTKQRVFCNALFMLKTAQAQSERLRLPI